MLAEQGIGALLQRPVREEARRPACARSAASGRSRISRTTAPSSATPIVGEYRGARIVSASPPASGGIALIDALNILEGFDYDALDPVTRMHLVVESMRRAHRDRALYLGDPDFVKVPVERLTSKYYADGQRTSLRLDRATPSDDVAERAIEARRARTRRISPCSTAKAIASARRSRSISGSAAA